MLREQGDFKPRFTEEDLLPISALQHLLFCERQCALIHLEQVWKDNPLTLEGAHMHRRVHDDGPRRELRGEVLICRGLPLRSFHLGLSGKSDAVEFRRVTTDLEPPSTETLPSAVAISGEKGLWSLFPIEYKRGKPKRELYDEVQICAQALCLEEMLRVEVPVGALYYGRIQHRYEVEFGFELRAVTERTVARLHELFQSRETPTAKFEPKCRNCSLLPYCLPECTGSHRSVRRYLEKAICDLDETETQ